MKADVSKAVPVVFLLLLSLIACNQTAPPPPAPEIPFSQMTPAQHLEKARSILTSGNIVELSDDQMQDATRHLKAIPKSAPEAAAAMTLEKHSIDAAQAKLLERVRQKYASDLEATLTAQGFDIVVTQLGDQLIVASDVLKDDAGRIQFLASIRSGKEGQGLCNMGFRRVVISASGVLAENHTYSLNCKSSGKQHVPATGL
jgi:soluble cytochrome b562